MPTLTIGLDTRWLEGKAAAAGTNTYITELVRALAADQEHQYRLWGSPVPGVAAPVDKFQGHYRRAWQLLWKTLGWPTADFPGPDVDLWHFTNYVAPPTRQPFVVSVLDLSFVEYPKFVEPKNLAYLQQFVPDTLKRAEHIIAISQATKDAVVEAFAVPDHKVTVTPLACDASYGSPVAPEEIDRIKDKYGIEEDYFLAVGTLEPRKNLRALLLAFAGLRKHTIEQLVVVGGHGWLFEETEALIKKLGLGSRVVFTGYAPKEELPALYQGAKLFVFPTFYEGFGLPVLEAMTAGTPVLCSNTSSLPEVGGAAALYFDPEDTEAMKLAIQRALEDETLRTRLSEEGRVQAAKFSWQRTAELTLGVYEKALA